MKGMYVGAVNQFMIINQGLQSATVKLVTSDKKMLECMQPPPPPPGDTPLYGIYRYVQPQRVCFSAVLVINKVSILADFSHLGLKKGMVFALQPWYGYVFKKPLFHHYRKENQQKPFTNYVYSNFTLVWTKELVLMLVRNKVLIYKSDHK